LLRVTGGLCARSLIHLWGPVILWMAGIFYFSSQSNLPSPFSSSRFDPFFHGIAHFGEYAILSALLYRALVKHHQPLGLSFGLALLFALLDEFHQSFVPGRDAELRDLALDAAGMGLSLIIIEGWSILRKKGKRNLT